MADNARLTGDRQLAVVAAALLAVLPPAVTMANEVRMYAMLSAFVIWAYYLSRRGFTDDDRWSRWLLAGLSLLMVYSHAIGFVAVLSNGVYSLGQLVQRRSTGRRYVPWLAVYGAVGLLAVPMLASSMLRDANLPGVADVDTVLTWLASAMVGDGVGYSRAQMIVGLGLCLVTTLCGLAHPKTRLLTFSFVFVPLLLAVAASVAVKPIYKANFFSTALSPFVALIMAQLIVDFD